MKFNLKSKTFWVSLASAIVIFVQSLSELFGFSVESDNILKGVNTICGVLIFMGILNNSATKSKNENISEDVKTKKEETNNSDVLNDSSANGEDLSI